MAVSISKMLKTSRYTDLQLVQVVPELLKAFFKSDEACGYLRGCCTSCLHHSLLVQKSLEAELELCRVQWSLCQSCWIEANLGLLLKVECIDFLKLSFLARAVSMQQKTTSSERRVVPV
jgi:hypothetical protein